MRKRTDLAFVFGLVALATSLIGPPPIEAQTYWDYLHHRPPPFQPESCKLALIRSVERAELHEIDGDSAILTAAGTAEDDRWRDEQLRLNGVQDGVATYDFVACPAPARTKAQVNIDASASNAPIGGIQRIVVRGRTNQQVIDVTAARLAPDPWSLRKTPWACCG